MDVSLERDIRATSARQQIEQPAEEPVALNRHALWRGVHHDVMLRFGWVLLSPYLLQAANYSWRDVNHLKSGVASALASRGDVRGEGSRRRRHR
jgi:hypothetical protein